MYRKSYCSTHSLSKIFKIYIKDFYVMGKVLSGQLSCTGTDLVLISGGVHYYHLDGSTFSFLVSVGCFNVYFA